MKNTIIKDDVYKAIYELKGNISALDNEQQEELKDLTGMRTESLLALLNLSKLAFDILNKIEARLD